MGDGEQKKGTLVEIIGDAQTMQDAMQRIGKANRTVRTHTLPSELRVVEARQDYVVVTGSKRQVQGIHPYGANVIYEIYDAK